jgi:NAD(P)-dependent dehydrogenase (short-subunit alcohol dehydrogenase family)
VRQPALYGRRILVIGGGQQGYGQEDPPIGIGRALALVAARHGASVAVADLDEAAAEETAELVRRDGAQAVAVVFDAAEEVAIADGIGRAAEALGGLDGLAVNTGIVGGWGLEHTSAEDWDRVFAVNVRGHFLACKHALGLMQAGGAMVLTSSTAALLPSTSSIPAYGASKAALDGVCRHVGKEAAARGVRVNVVMPGLIDTPLGRLASQAQPDRNATPVPLGRQGTGEEVAEAAIFLLSNAASYVAGQTLAVDGGLTNLG